MALPPAVWHRVANATDLWDCSACGFTATALQQATHNSWHNQLATAMQLVEGSALTAKNDIAHLQAENTQLRLALTNAENEIHILQTQARSGIKTPEAPAPKKLVKRKRQLCFECGLPSHPKEKLEKRTISTKGKPDREEYAHYECWQGWLTKAKTIRREQEPDSNSNVGLFQQRDSTLIGIESPERKESDYNGITPEQEKEATARLFGESK